GGRLGDLEVRAPGDVGVARVGVVGGRRVGRRVRLDAGRVGEIAGHVGRADVDGDRPGHAPAGGEAGARAGDRARGRARVGAGRARGGDEARAGREDVLEGEARVVRRAEVVDLDRVRQVVAGEGARGGRLGDLEVGAPGDVGVVRVGVVRPLRVGRRVR